jgi:5-methylcytosine-specific restriction endonuclease McrA
MALPWFKIYTEARHNPKLNRLNGVEFRAWFELLCYAAEQDERGTVEGHNLSLLADIVARQSKCVLLSMIRIMTDLRSMSFEYDESRDWYRIQFLGFASRNSEPHVRPLKRMDPNKIERAARSRMRKRREKYQAMPYDQYLQTDHWQEVRRLALGRADNRCQLCNDGDSTLDVHHRTYENLGQESENDTIVLCRGCHTTFHEKMEVSRNGDDL